MGGSIKNPNAFTITLLNPTDWSALKAKLCDISSYKALSSGLLLLWFLSVQSRAYSEAALPNVVLTSPTAAEYGEVNARVKALERATCNDASRYFEKPMVVQDFVGANVRSIRVVHFFRQSKSPKSDEIRKLIKTVWHGTFQFASCGILWSEGTLWSIECTLEFKDGKQGVLITDGVHVALRDHEGKNWFFRLLPAAQ